VNGTVVVDPITGALTYTPNPNFFGKDSLIYKVCDSGNPSLCDTAKVYFNVSPVNDAPIANFDKGITPEATPVSINVVSNDTDIDSAVDPTTVTIVTQPLNGLVSVNPITGVLTYTPNALFNGQDSLVYKVCDNGTPSLCDTAIVYLTVTGVNHPPLATVDAATTNEDVPVVVNILTNDTDVDRNIDPKTVTIRTQPVNGTVKVDPLTGAITYTPNPNFNGKDSLIYKVCDSGNPVLCDTAKVFFNITPVNDPPIANLNTGTTPENTPLSINVILNDTDIDGAIDPTTVTITAQPLHGTVSVSPVTGLLTYTPNPNFNGKDSLIYRVCDNGTPLPVQCDTAIVFLTVTGVNHAPIANVDGATTIPNTPVTVAVLTNDTDVDGNIDPKTVTISTQPVNGTVSVNPITGAITYTPNANFSGKDSLIYRVCDSGNPQFCDTAKVFFTVSAAIACDCATRQDTVAPKFVGVPANITLSCSASLPTVLPTATDNCDLNPRITMADVTARGTCASNYVLTRTWTVTDKCGNSATASQLITVEDKTRPTLVGVPANVTLACGQVVPTVPSVTATDSCGTATVTMVQQTGLTYISRIWTATDACGNSDSRIQTISFATNCGTPTLSLGNLVWNDVNNNGKKDDKEGGIPGVEVLLYSSTDNIKGNADDVLVATQLTTNKGAYNFTGLLAGNYWVQLNTIPVGYVSSTGDGPTDNDGAGAFEPSNLGDINDRDHGSLVGTKLSSAIVNLALNSEPTNDGDNNPNTNWTVDFGLYVPQNAGVFDLALTKKYVPKIASRGLAVRQGDTIRFRLSVVNQGTINAFNVKVSDYVPVGLEYQTALNTAAKTGNFGNWAADSTFTLPLVEAGQSVNIDILLRVNHAFDKFLFTNKAEISFATDDPLSTVNHPDIDSRADKNPDNDVVGKQNNINNEKGDEDDHDYAYVFDRPKYDPIGYIYCDKTGKLVTGGTISVDGPGLVYIQEDGSSGRYQFYTDGTPGTYTISYNNPLGYPLSTTCLQQPDSLDLSTVDGSARDRDGVLDGNAFLGSGAVNGYMNDHNCASNPFYLNINSMGSSDPILLHNNIPVRCTFLGALVCQDNNFNSIIDAGDTPLDSVKIYLVDCTTNLTVDSTLSVNGKYRFDGLHEGNFKIYAQLPTGYRYSIANVGSNEFLDSDVDSSGYSACIPLLFGECDTTKAQICLIPNIYDLSLKKTLAIGQSAQVAVGDFVDFHIQVKNTGSVDAYNVDITDQLPSNLILADNTWTTNGFTATRRIPFLPFGAILEIPIRTLVVAPSTAIVNVATVRGANRPNGVQVTERNLTNNTDSARVSLRINNCALTPNFNANAACAGAEASFSVVGTYATLAWDFGDGKTSNLPNPTHIYAVGGTYSVVLTVTDGLGCTASVTKQVIIHPMIWAYAGLDRTICEGDSVHLLAQGSTHYFWTAGAASLSDIFTANPIATPSVTTTYIVEVGNDYGCVGTDTVVVKVVPKPNIVSRTGNLSTCTNGVMPAKITLNQAITSYEISGSAGWRDAVVSGNTLTFNTVLNGAFNNIRVILRGVNGCSVTDTFNLFLAGNPKADFVAIEPFCNGNDVKILFKGRATAGATLTYTEENSPLGLGVVVYRSLATATRPLGDTTIMRFPSLGSKLITLTVNDGGCTDAKSQSIYVRKTPVVTITTLDQTTCANACVQLNATTTLPGMVMWTATSSPSGLGATDILNPMACPTKTTTYVLTVMEAGGCMGRDTVTISIDTSRAILRGVPANAAAACDAIPTAPTVTEIGGNVATMTEVKTAGNCTGNYILTRTWTAANACGSTGTASQVITVQDITPPVFTSVPAAITINCDQTQPNILAIATDNCSAPVITIANTTNGTGCNYTITRTFTATDACGNTATAAQIITVHDNTVPILTNIPTNVTVDCHGNMPTTTPSVSDVCDPNPRLTMTQTTTDSTCYNRKTVVRTWTATDACGNTATASQTIKVYDNVAPVITPINPRLAGFRSGDTLTLSCEDITIFKMGDATATDNCDGSLTPTFEDVASRRGVCSVDGYSLLIECRWLAVDRCGNQSEWRIFLKVTDNKPPVLATCPANITVNGVASIPTPPSVSATDNCTDVVDVTMKELTTPIGNGCDYNLTRTWTATDACGNFATCRQVITVHDSLEVKFVTTPATCVGNNGTITMIPTQGINYAWSDAGTGANRTALASGNYTVTASRGTCQKVFTITVTNDCNCTPPVATAQKTDATCGSSDGTATILVDSVSKYTFVWSSGGLNTNSRTGLAAGIYTVTVSRNGVANCQTVSTVTIGNNTANCCTPPIATVQKTDATCGSADGTATILVDTITKYTFTWSSGGANTNSRANLAAGTYTVTVSRNGVANCQTVSTITIGNNTANCCTPPIATVQKTDATCGSANGTATILVDTIAKYTFIWSSGGLNTNSRTNLAAGVYTVTVSKNGLANCQTVSTVTIGNNTSNCCTNLIAQTSVVKILTDCTAKADVCVEIPANNIAAYTIMDNGTAYTGGFGTCLGGSTLYFGTGSHTVIFTSPRNLGGCKDTLVVKVLCSPELVIHKVITFPQTDSTCLTASQLGLTGTIVSVVNECAASANNTQIVIDPISYCIRYKSLSVGVDTACLRIQTSTGGVATMKLVITVGLPRCGKVISQDSVIVTDACTAKPKVCVNIPFDVIPDFDILLNGVTYTGGFDGCKNDTSFAYTYFTIPGRGATGPYSLDYWTVNGVTHTAPTVNNIDELVVLMNAWDPTGHWIVNHSSLTIVGGDRGKTYGSLKLTRQSNGSYGVMQLNSNIIPQATIMDIQRGRSTLVFINRNTGCTDTLVVNAACLTPQYVESKLYIGDKDTLCIATNELMGTRYRLTKLKASSQTFARFADLSGTTCVTRAGVAVGTEKATYVISDEYGLNDTTYVTTFVYARAVKRPRAFKDTASTITGHPILIDILANDTLDAAGGKVQLLSKPQHGEVVLTPDMRVIYTPDLDFCNGRQPDVFTYELCSNGGCDTARVEVIVVCDKIKIHNGFSPNGDGVNDVFVIEGIENFKNNTVSVYNRWGNEVMKTKGYKNDWNGTWHNQSLPDGTYFYLLNDGEGHILSGYVEIMR
jgi:gliding motility-associated-like protein/uncharacterized repeat protein (TIGR01451 family)